MPATLAIHIVPSTQFIGYLEYYMRFWSPHYRTKVEALERVQQRFIRMFGSGGIGYRERLDRCG